MPTGSLPEARRCCSGAPQTASWRPRFAALRPPAEDSGMENLDAVAVGAGLRGCRAAIEGSSTRSSTLPCAVGLARVRRGVGARHHVGSASRRSDHAAASRPGTGRGPFQRKPWLGRILRGGSLNGGHLIRHLSRNFKEGLLQLSLKFPEKCLTRRPH